MREHAANLEFEEAARLRDELRRLESQDLGLDPDMSAAKALAKVARNKSAFGMADRGPTRPFADRPGMPGSHHARKKPKKRRRR